LDQVVAREDVFNQGWLGHTPLPFRRAVLDRCLREQFKAGTQVYSIGDEAGGMFGIVSGGLGVSIAPGERGPYVAHFAMPGTWFGEAAAITRQPRRIGLTATRDSELLHLPLHCIDEIVRGDPSAWRFFALVTIAHLDTAIGGCDDLMKRDHVQRFVAVLLRLGGCRLASPGDEREIEVDMNHEDLAYMANLARTTAGSILRKLELDGHVALSYRRISILRPDALRKMLCE